MKRLAIGLVLTGVGTATPCMAERVAPTTEYLIQIHQTFDPQMFPSGLYTPVLLISFGVALFGVIQAAQKKSIPILSPLFLLPSIGFLAFMLIFLAFRSFLAEMVVDMAGWNGPLPTWGMPPFLLGSKWYGAVVLSVGWFLTHPIRFQRDSKPTRAKAFRIYLPFLLVAGGVLIWLHLGYFVGFMWKM